MDFEATRRAVDHFRQVRVRREQAWREAVGSLDNLEPDQLAALLDEISSRLAPVVDFKSTPETEQAAAETTTPAEPARENAPDLLPGVEDDAASGASTPRVVSKNKLFILRAMHLLGRPATPKEIAETVAANNPEANVISIPAEIKRLTTLRTGPLLAHAGRNDMGRPIYKLTPAGEEADIM